MRNMDDETLKTFAYVNASTYRVKVVKALKNDVKTPTKISKDAEIIPNHISNVLRQLKDHEVAVCINEESRKGRLYRLTEMGEEIANNLK